MKCVMHGLTSLCQFSLYQGRLRQCEQDIQQVPLVARFAQQLACLCTQSDCTRILSLGQHDKCQDGEDGHCALLICPLAVKGEALLTQCIRSFIVSLQAHNQSKSPLPLHETEGITKHLLQRQQLFQQGLCTVVRTLVACKLGGTKKDTRAHSRR